MRKKIGSGITNSNGVASCSYTGKAVGKMDVIAEFTNDGSTVVSQPYTVTDCVYYDDSTNNTGLLVRMTKTASDGKSVLTATGDNAHWIFKQNSRVFTLPLIIEFDVDTITTTNDPALNINDGSHDYFVWITNTGHHKFSVSQDGVTKLDGSVDFSKSGSLPTDNAVRLSFLLRTNGDTLTYDNLEIYPTS